MRIVFFCGALEPGRDGVGDYTRMLSTELVRMGHECILVSLNDRHITGIAQSNEQVGDQQMAVYRMPANLSWEKRVEYLSKVVHEYDPDWLSLQYVSFSFDEKGMPFRFASRLKMIGGSRKWHIMFHELWVGMDKQSSRKESVWGSVQRHLTKYLLSVLQPFKIHTHTGLYKEQLEKMGTKCRILPLPTNLPVLYPKEVKQKLSNWSTGNPIDLVIFGTIHKGAPITAFLNEVEYYRKAEQVELNLVVIGKESKTQQEWIDAWKEKGLNVVVLGQLSEQEVSKTLTHIHFGISTTPAVLMEKSSTVATMRAHGVHLLTVAREWFPRKTSFKGDPKFFMEYKPGTLNHFLKSQPSSLPPSVEQVAGQFISNLSSLK